MILIKIDECLSWRIGEAIRRLKLPRGFDLETPKRLNQQGVQDVDWIADFASRGGRCFISGDARMRTVVLERAALQASGLVAIFPPAGKFYDNLRKYRQAAFIMAWLPAILDLAENSPPGTHYRLPPGFSGERSHIRQLEPLRAE